MPFCLVECLVGQPFELAPLRVAVATTAAHGDPQGKGRIVAVALFKFVTNDLGKFLKPFMIDAAEDDAELIPAVTKGKIRIFPDRFFLF